MKKVFACILFCLCIFVAMPVSAQDDYSDEEPDFYYGTVSNDLLTKIPIRTLNNINVIAETDTALYRIRSLEVQHVKDISPEALSLFGVTEDHCTAVTAYIAAENKLEVPTRIKIWESSLSADDGTSVTRTKDISDLCTSIYQPHQTEVVCFTYVFSDLEPADITELTFTFPCPEDADGNSFGEETEIKISLDDYVE